MRAEPEDHIRDALALIEAVHRRDGEGRRIVLASCDTRAVALVLASISADLITDLAEWWRTEPGDLLNRLREHHAGS